MICADVGLLLAIRFRFLCCMLMFKIEEMESFCGRRMWMRMDIIAPEALIYTSGECQDWAGKATNERAAERLEDARVL